MFYKTKVQDHIRVEPKFFGLNVNEAVTKAVRSKFSGFIDQELGIVIDVAGVNEIGEGVIIPGDGASYYHTTFELIIFKPEMHEVVTGKIKDIADFGAFVTMGPIEGMVHIGQTMDDFVSFSKDKLLTGKESKRSLKVNDTCRARIIAISFKDVTNPKIGLTMRQAGLGKVEWIQEDYKKEEAKGKKK
jgi:DNA-directed RNA polymerase subunit E'